MSKDVENQNTHGHSYGEHHHCHCGGHHHHHDHDHHNHDHNHDHDHDHESHAHKHDHDEEEEGPEIDEHVWTSPKKAMEIVKKIAKVASEIDVAEEALFLGLLWSSIRSFEEVIKHLEHA